MAQMIHYHYTDTFSYADIKDMDASGILFENGLSIFFEECQKNFSRVYPEGSGKCIAERSSTVNPPYYEFYTCGKSMVILFDGLGRDTMREFNDFHRRLVGYGYSTYDLT